jgi:K+-sensing histidine kinase KdpD
MLRVITHGADRLDRFVEGIVDLARIEAGDMKLYRNWGAVDDIIDAALAQAEPLTRQHQIQVSVEDELPVVRVDARAVAEVIYTLIDNASKYAPPETLIVVEATRVADDMIEIAVADQGPGIPAPLRERVFERFYRAPSNGPAGGHTGGIGMGLAIAKGIVEAHRGHIWIEDGTANRGARIVFTVPVGDDEPRGSDANAQRGEIFDQMETERLSPNRENGE